MPSMNTHIKDLKNVQHQLTETKIVQNDGNPVIKSQYSLDFKSTYDSQEMKDHINVSIERAAMQSKMSKVIQGKF